MPPQLGEWTIALKGRTGNSLLFRPVFSWRATNVALPLCGGRFVGLQVFPERDHTGNQPPSPHLVNLALEVIHIVSRKVGESPLPGQIIADRQAADAAWGALFGPAGRAQHSAFDLVPRATPRR